MDVNKDALFDFDEDVDELSQVSERYPIQMFSERTIVPDMIAKENESVS